MTVGELPAPSLLVDVPNEVGEGPLIDPRSGALVWVDMTAGIVHVYDPATAGLTTTAVPTILGAVAARATGSGFAAATANGFGLIDNGTLVMLDRCLPEPELRMNDAKCDARGRLWAGSTELAFEPGRGRLHCWDGVAPSTVAAEGFTLPNGLGWSPDSRRMYLVDSMTHDVLIANFDLERATVGTFEPWARITSGLPDGLAVDVEGCVWVAVWGGSEVLRFSPEGEVIARVAMPVTQPSSCAISADGTLYITSARAGLSAESLRVQPDAGAVFTLPVAVAGVPVAPMEVWDG